MTKKITVSVPDELHEKMQKWKNHFNFSSVFQKAVSEVIEKKETFKGRLKEVASMEQVIKRLKAEKVNLETDYYDQGKKDGLQWAKAASYDELQYALKWQTMEEMEEIQMLQGGLISCDPTRDEVLGSYFLEVMEEDEYMGFYDSAPNEFFVAWEGGWKEAVQAFFEEIEDKL